MATRREPRFKLCRHLGVNVCGHPKALERGVKSPKGGKKISEYGRQLLEKQKITAYYRILEKQFARYLRRSEMSKEATGVALLKQLECRLDNIVYRIGFGRSIRQARQFVSHGHILVNGKKVDIPSYGLKENDVVSVREASRTNDKIKSNFEELGGLGVTYIEKDQANFSGRLTRIPSRDEIPIDVNEILVVELFSK